MDNSQSSKQIKIGIILSYITLAVSNIIPFLYTPLMLSLLGQSEYGLYKIAGSTSSFLGLMSFGIGTALTRYLIKEKVEKGQEAEENVFGLFLLIFQILSFLVIALGAVLVFNLNYFYENSLSENEFKTIQILIAMMVVVSAISLSSSPYTTVVSAHERFIFLQVMNLVTTVLAPCLNIIVLLLGYKSIGLTVTSLLMIIVTRIIYIFYVRKKMHIKPRFNDLPTDIIKEILFFSFWVFLGDIVNQLYNATDIVIIGTVPGLATTGAAVYNIGTTFSTIIVGLSIVVPGFFKPRANKMVFSGASNQEMSDFFIKSGRFQAAIVFLFVSGFVAFGRQFINFYVGPDYKESYWVALLIMIPSCVPLVQSIGHSILEARNLHKYRSIMYLVIAVINVVFTILLVDRYGIIGAAIPTGVASLLGPGFYMNWFYWKKVKLDIPRFWKNMLPFFIINALLCVIALIVSQWIDFYVVWKMAVGIIVYVLLYVFLLWKFVFDEDEKNIVRNTFKKLHLKKKTS